MTIVIKQRKRDQRALEDLASTCGEHRSGNCPTFIKSATLRLRRSGGLDSVLFADRFRGKSLEPGSYVAKIVAVDRDGLRSAPGRARFSVGG